MLCLVLQRNHFTIDHLPRCCTVYVQLKYPSTTIEDCVGESYEKSHDKTQEVNESESCKEEAAHNRRRLSTF